MAGQTGAACWGFSSVTRWVRVRGTAVWLCPPGLPAAHDPRASRGQGLSVDAIAAQRGIQADSVQGESTFLLYIPAHVHGLQ